MIHTRAAAGVAGWVAASPGGARGCSRRNGTNRDPGPRCRLFRTKRSLSLHPIYGVWHPLSCIVHVLCVHILCVRACDACMLWPALCMVCMCRHVVRCLVHGMATTLI